MSAPNNAKPVGKFDGADQVRVECLCGWTGMIEELLGVDDEDTLWCPQCHRATWFYE
jgi:hypothetical protein